MSATVEAALRRHRLLIIAALCALTLLSWAWLIAGAGTGMDPAVSLAPPRTEQMPQVHSGMAMEQSTSLTIGDGALTFSMWWIMMAAMMLPAAAPTILLYAKAASKGEGAVRPASGSFLAGYLIAWGGFALLATLAQIALERIGIIHAMTMASASSRTSAAILIASGLYQLSPLKNACLRQCRSPALFLSHYYRAGAVGALRMGLIHGSFCVGCCWLLMGLLFVGGVMNLAWVALLTLVVAAEKLLAHGKVIGIASGIALIAWGIRLLAA